MRRAFFFLFSSVVALSSACGPDSNGGSGGRGGSSDGTAGSGATGGGGSSGAGTGGVGGAAGRAGSGSGGVAGGASGGTSGGGASGSSGSSGAAGSRGGASGSGGVSGGGGAAGSGGTAGATGGTAGTKDGGAGASGGGAGNADAGPKTDATIDVAPPLDVASDAFCMGIGAENVELGTPTDADPSDDVILKHDYFVISYNPTKNDPNWVSWHLSASDIGSTARQDNFSPDSLLPAMYYHVKTADYTGSGYDRGHLSPSADNTMSVAQNSDSFLMTNMIPQYHALNAGPWEVLETFERSLALTDKKDVYIIAGGIFAASPPTIGPGIAVPKSCFKIVVALDPGQGPCDITLQTPIYAVVMPNETTTSGTPWGMYTTSIDDIEMQTGYDFLSGLPLNIQTAVEAVITKAP